MTSRAAKSHLRATKSEWLIQRIFALKSHQFRVASFYDSKLGWAKRRPSRHENSAVGHLKHKLGQILFTHITKIADFSLILPSPSNICDSSTQSLIPSSMASKVCSPFSSSTINFHLSHFYNDWMSSHIKVCIFSIVWFFFTYYAWVNDWMHGLSWLSLIKNSYQVKTILCDLLMGLVGFTLV